MRTFLDEISKKIISSNNLFEDIKIIVPNRRAISFLKKSLSKNLSEPMFCPEIINIEDFMEEMSGLKKIQRIELLLEFYEIYQKHNSDDEIDDFNKFLRWANVVLDDFNEMDFHLLNVDEFFEYESSLIRIEEWAKGDLSNNLLKTHSSFFSSLKIYYEKIYESLIEKNQGSLGIIFREAVANLEIYLQNTSKFHFFIGFNALNKCESQIFQEFLSLKKGDIIWDIDKYLYEDESNTAGKFIRGYYNEWNYLRQKKEPFSERNFELKKNISLVGIPKNVGQAKYAAQISEKFYGKSKKEKTAIILGQESLLTPVLSGFSDNKTKWNVTMGYPIYQTPSSDFFDIFFKMHMNISSLGFYYKNIDEIFSTSWVQEIFEFNKIDIKLSLAELKKSNQSYIDPSFFLDQGKQSNLTAVFFDKFRDTGNFLGRLIKVADFFIFFLQSLDSEKVFLELNYFIRIKEIFSELSHTKKIKSLVNNIDSLYKIFKFLIGLEKINFVTEFSTGIQIMGILETRLLDFDNVIITNVNEGILPPGRKDPSFLSYEARKKFGLFTFLDKDAIYTYHFYRLLQRAKNIYLIYNIESGGLNSGEKSRFIYQLKFNNLDSRNLKEIYLGFNNQKQYPLINKIKKTQQVEKRLIEIASKGFSPSSLIEYLTDPMEFYYKRILGIRESEKIETTISHLDRGTLVHEVLEELYKPYLNQTLSIENFDLMEQNLNDLIEEKYSIIYGRTYKKTGRNYIIFEVLKKQIKDFLVKEKDLVKRGRVLKIIHLEKSLEKDISVAGIPFPIKLVGKVDRIDTLDEIVRIVDYKTGKILSSDLKAPAVENLFTDSKYISSFQVLTYCYLYSSFIDKNHLVQAGIISFQNLKENFMPLLLKSSQKNTSNNFIIDSSIISQFEKFLTKLFKDIFNKKMPFRRIE
ncbi:MAG: PD-(D/E)XK nuclease family protein [Bacteroidota bacterium]|nr:PD-(D/E)XK nuclease family protein [Bacteroidota bacterium]